MQVRTNATALTYQNLTEINEKKAKEKAKLEKEGKKKEDAMSGFASEFKERAKNDLTDAAKRQAIAMAMAGVDEVLEVGKQVGANLLAWGSPKGQCRVRLQPSVCCGCWCPSVCVCVCFSVYSMLV